MDAGLRPALGGAERKKTSAAEWRMAFVFLLSARPTRAERGPSVASALCVLRTSASSA
jgi:hypothetical protein